MWAAALICLKASSRRLFVSDTDAGPVKERIVSLRGVYWLGPVHHEPQAYSDDQREGDWLHGTQLEFGIQVRKKRKGLSAWIGDVE